MDPTNYAAPLEQAASLPTPDVGAAFTQGIQAQLQQQVQRAQMQRQLGQQQMLDAATKSFIASPTPENTRALAALNPQGFQAIQQQHTMGTADQQRQDLTDFSAVQGYLSAKQPDDAKAIIQKRVDAGQKQLAPLLQTIDQNPDAAKAAVNYWLAGAMGPDKFAESFASLGKEGRDQAEAPGKMALTTAQTAQASAAAAKAAAETGKIITPPPKTMSAGLGPDGKPQFYNENAPPPTNGGNAPTTNSGQLDGVVQQIIQSESGGNATAKNPNSSATGTGQFVAKTWIPLISQLHPDLVQGKTTDQILALRNDPQLSGEATTAYAQQNAQALGDAGLPVNASTLVLAHRLGPDGAKAVLGAPATAPLTQILPPDVIAANPQYAKMTVGQLSQSLASKFGTTSIDATPGDPNATGDAFLKTLPPARARLLQAVANGDMAVPPLIARNPAQSQLFDSQLLQFDPQASAINLQSRQKTRNSYMSGPDSVITKSLNTFAGHLDKLDHAIDLLDNTGFDWVNRPSQYLGKKLGNAQTQTAVANFNTWKGLASSEIVKVLRGTGGAEADIKYWQTQLDQAQSPATLHAVTKAMAEAVQSRLESQENGYNTGMATLGKPMPLLTSGSRQILDRVASAGGDGGGDAPKVVVNPQTGQRLTYDAASKSWNPG